MKEELRNEFEYLSIGGAIELALDKLEAKDKECAAKIAAGERLRMEDAMSAINEANGLREKIKEQELIIYGIEEGAEQWKSLCADKDKEIAELKRYNEMQKGGFDFLYDKAKSEITDLKAEIERLKGEPTKERIMNAVRKSLQWDDGEILGIDILDLEKKVKEALNTNNH